MWSPTFDWLLAQLVRLAGVAHDPAAMELLLVWVPPVIGASTVVALYGIAQHYFNARVAFLAAALLCFLPANTWYSQIGFVDHHVAVAFVTTLLLGAGTALLGQAQETSSPTPACLGRACFLGVAMAASLLVYPGSSAATSRSSSWPSESACSLQRAGSRRSDGRERLPSHTSSPVSRWLRWSAGNQWDLWGSFESGRALELPAHVVRGLHSRLRAAFRALETGIWRGDPARSQPLGAWRLLTAWTGVGGTAGCCPSSVKAVGQGWAWLSTDESPRRASPSPLRCFALDARGSRSCSRASSI